MDFDYTPKVKGMQARLLAFFDQHIYLSEHHSHEEIETNHCAGNAWTPTRAIEELKPLAHKARLQNLFLLRLLHVPEGLSNLEYTPLCEVMGRVPWAPEVLNYFAPDTDNIETLERHTSEELKDRRLESLLRGEIRSTLLMTEPAVTSSDVADIEYRIGRQDDEYAINDHRWWSLGAGDPHCAVYIAMGKTNPDASRYKQQSIIMVPVNAPSTAVMRPLSMFDYDDVPHSHMGVDPKGVRVSVGNILFGENRDLEIAQGHFGPGRTHHCIRSIGVAGRALELVCKRLSSYIAFGRAIAQHSVWYGRIAKVRCMIERARPLTFKAAYMTDTVGNKVTKTEIAMIKVITPNITYQVVGWTTQTHGGGGVLEDFPLALTCAHQRTLRLADGPDEARRTTIVRLKLARRLYPKNVVDMLVTHGV